MEFQIPIVEKLKIQTNNLALLNEHHVVGLFYHHFNDSGQDASFINQYKKQWIHNQIILEELVSISKHANAHETSATILKGTHLLLDLYTDLGSRFLSDIDLLISNVDLPKWELILSELGYIATSNKTFYGNNFKREWHKTVGEIEINIELHTKLFFHLKNENWQVVGTSFLNITKLKTEDFYIHLCGHLASQHTFLKLYWLFDIYFYHQKYADQINWDYLKLKSIENGLYRSVQMCLWILKQHLGVNLGKKIEDRFEIRKNNWWKKILTINFLMYPLAKKSHYIIIKHATKDRLTDALRYDLTWFSHYKIRK